MASTAALRMAAVFMLLMFAGQLLPRATPAPDSCSPTNTKCLACVEKCREPCQRDPAQCREVVYFEPRCAKQKTSDTCAPNNAKCLACVDNCREPCQRTRHSVVRSSTSMLNSIASCWLYDLVMSSIANFIAGKYNSCI